MSMLERAEIALDAILARSVGTAYDAAFLAIGGAIVLWLSPKLWLIARSPEVPIQVSVLSAAGILLSLLFLAGTTIALLLLLRRKIREISELKTHKCPEHTQLPFAAPKRGDTFQGNKFKNSGVAWIPTLLYVDGGAMDTVGVKGPICENCNAPLYFEDHLSSESAECPTCKKTYQFDTFIHAVREKAKGHAIGLYYSGNLVFGGMPQKIRIVDTPSRRKFPNGLRYDVSKERGRGDSAYCPDEKCDTKVKLPNTRGYGVRKPDVENWTCPGCDKTGEYTKPD